MQDPLFTWIGATDLDAPLFHEKKDVDPIANALEAHGYTRAIMLSNYLDDDRVSAYIDWLVEQGKTVPSSRSPKPR